MGHYNSQYESYYNSIVNKRNSNVNSLNSSFSGSKKENWIARRLTQELLGVLLMAMLLIFCRVYETPQTQAVYSFSKSIVSNNVDYVRIIDQIKLISTGDNLHDKAIEVIDNLKSKITGGETIREKIKNQFSLPIKGEIISKGKDGIDITANKSEKVFASFQGKVKECGEDDKLGKYIIMDHGEGIETVYSNLGSIQVQNGNVVKKGEAIGMSNASENYVHFQVLFMGQNNGLESIIGNYN
ncbi:stage II sporulation protein Q [Clostridium homopropionicum DSM 5847]|uniref:Stage II sporulation protein Q n=1 Tax=Clostridium homopropionicum DSM 5847 TaxID=1121318 RepID=A0A0L6ZES6_9CLOT|nr:M23 family metallopeptidase [Clostridium homopropionicum]KOA21278.1 stage II sporulation protein Q [Clostridium homopropionicum DSM 5847]SFG29693.1 Peptidase family M23 [Clostridium homopropionicum]